MRAFATPTTPMSRWTGLQHKQRFNRKGPNENEGNDVPSRFICPVCHGVCFRPVYLRCCGHLYCKHCLQARWHRGEKDCPICHRKIGKWRRNHLRTHRRLARKCDRVARRHPAVATLYTPMASPLTIAQTTSASVADSQCGPPLLSQLCDATPPPPEPVVVRRRTWLQRILGGLSIVLVTLGLLLLGLFLWPLFMIALILLAFSASDIDRHS